MGTNSKCPRCSSASKQLFGLLFEAMRRATKDLFGVGVPCRCCISSREAEHLVFHLNNASSLRSQVPAKGAGLYCALAQIAEIFEGPQGRSPPFFLLEPLKLLRCCRRSWEKNGTQLELFEQRAPPPPKTEQVPQKNHGYNFKQGITSKPVGAHESHQRDPPSIKNRSEETPLSACKVQGL